MICLNCVSWKGQTNVFLFTPDSSWSKTIFAEHPKSHGEEKGCRVYFWEMAFLHPEPSWFGVHHKGAERSLGHFSAHVYAIYIGWSQSGSTPSTSASTQSSSPIGCWKFCLLWWSSGDFCFLNNYLYLWLNILKEFVVILCYIKDLGPFQVPDF